MQIRKTTKQDQDTISKFIEENWGGEPLRVHNKKYYPSKMDGFVSYENNKITGFLIYEIRNKDCEIIVLEALEKYKGIGTKLVDKLKEFAKEQKCDRIFLMTTNDNLDAFRFYQKRNFTICGIHYNTMKEARKLKPSIPELGDYDIPLRDEIDLELKL